MPDSTLPDSTLPDATLPDSTLPDSTLPDSGFSCRTAGRDDLPALRAVMTAATHQLQQDHLDPTQISASEAIMGLDTRLIDDDTYLVVECDGQVAGCGGWSRRATAYGGDHSTGRDDRLLDPRTEPARIRAMYTNPRFARRGVGRLILDRCEQAARAGGFTSLELTATLAGEPLYRSAGFTIHETFDDTSTGTVIPLRRMTKVIALDISSPAE